MIFQATHYIGLSFDKKGKYDENEDDPSCWEGQEGKGVPWLCEVHPSLLDLYDDD